jgi:hypothetical protein
MKLSTIFEDLENGELSQLSIGGGTIGAIAEEDYAKVIGYVNVAMVELYKRFPIMESELIIDLYPTIMDYVLTYDFAASNTTGPEPIKYIQDTAENPFPDDVLQIMEVFDEDMGIIPLNDDNALNSVYTPTWNTLQVPEPVEGASFSILYRAYPAEIPTSTTDLTAVDVHIPRQLSTALYAYIAYRAHLGMTERDNNKISASFSRFNAICNDVRFRGTLNRSDTTNNKLDINGWP